jgi:hypothetical protein
MMASTAMAARKCEVHLYEKCVEVMSLQKSARHRFVHPTINFWPDSPLHPTTQFPFLDWHADKCESIIERLRNEWDRVLRQWMHVRTGHEITELLEDENSPGKWRLKIGSQGANQNPNRPFDYVVLTVGFGTEIPINGADNKSYWAPDDQLSLPGQERPWEGFVTGSGDGAIIDALRAVHGDFRNGRLCLEVAEILETMSVKSRISALEAKARSQSDEDAEWLCKYRDEYYDIVSSTPDVVIRKLDCSLENKSGPGITLIGKKQTPFLGKSAPIHKFMLAHAMQKNKIHYITGRVVDGPKIETDGRTIDPGKDLIVRHGPKRDMSGLIDTEVIKKLRKEQEVLNNLPLNDPCKKNHWYQRWKNCPAQVFDSQEFVNNRYPAAKALMNDLFGMELTRGPGSDNGGWRYFAWRDKDLEDEISRQEIDCALPPNLFGVKLEPAKDKPKAYSVV